MLGLKFPTQFLLGGYKDSNLMNILLLHFFVTFYGLYDGKSPSFTTILGEHVLELFPSIVCVLQRSPGAPVLLLENSRMPIEFWVGPKCCKQSRLPFTTHRASLLGGSMYGRYI